MAKIILEIEDEIVNDLEQGIITKSIVGSLFGTQDEFITLLIKGIKKGKKEIIIERKKKKKEKKTKKKRKRKKGK